MLSQGNPCKYDLKCQVKSELLHPDLIGRFFLEFLQRFPAPFLPLFVILILFGVVALLFSMLLPSARSAVGFAGALLVINFLLVGLSNINPDLQAVYELTPLYFYQGGSAVAGVDWVNLLGLAGFALILALLAWLFFQRREIRVGGEGGWKLPKLALGGRRS